MKEKHIALIYPGLSDGAKSVSFLTNHWENQFSITPHVSSVPWNDSAETLESKIIRGLQLIDHLSSQADLVSIIGISGGGSFSLNLFLERLDTIHRVVNVCGRVRTGENVTPTPEKASLKKPRFKDSVLLAEKSIEKLDKPDLNRIVTVRPRFGDEVVPVTTVPVEGAYNISTPTFGHMISIGYCLVFPQEIIRFLKEE